MRIKRLAISLIILFLSSLLFSFTSCEKNIKGTYDFLCYVKKIDRKHLTDNEKEKLQKFENHLTVILNRYLSEFFARAFASKLPIPQIRSRQKDEIFTRSKDSSDLQYYGTTQVKGRVTYNGKPIAGVLIDCIDERYFIQKTVHTDENGYYEFINVVPLGIPLKFRAWSNDHGTLWWDNKTSFDTADTITINDKDTVTINFNFIERYYVKGRVTSEGKNIKDILVLAINTETLEEIASDYTDKYGKYSIQIPEGMKFKLFAVDPNKNLAELWNGNAEFYYLADELILNKDTSGIDFNLPQTGKIQGKITNEQGHAVKNLFVMALNYWGVIVNGAITDEKGEYTITGLPPNSEYFICTSDTADYQGVFWDGDECFFTAEPVKVIPNKTIKDINIQLKKSGFLSAQINECKNIHLSLFRINDNNEISFYTNIFPDKEGKILAPVLAGKYIVRTINQEGYADLYYPDSYNLQAAKIISITTGDTLNLKFNLQKGGTVEGNIKTVNNDELVFALVLAIKPETKEIYNFTSPDTFGHYSLTLPPDINYKLLCLPHFISEKYYYQYYDKAQELSKAKNVSVRSGEKLKNIDFILGEGGKISGYAFSGTAANPLADVHIGIKEIDGNYQEIITKQTETDLNGYYSLSGLQNKNYKIFAIWNKDTLWWNQQKSENTATPISVKTGDSTESVNFIFNKISTVGPANKQNTSLKVTPNPINNRAFITFRIDKPSIVNLKIYNNSGESVANLISKKHFNAGVFKIPWNTGALPSGIYFIKLVINDNTSNHYAFSKIIISK